MSRHVVKVHVVIVKHVQEGAAKLMRTQLQFRVKPEHQGPEVAAILAQFPPAEHFYKREHLCGGCADGIMGGRNQKTMTPPHKASCPLQQYRLPRTHAENNRKKNHDQGGEIATTTQPTRTQWGKRTHPIWNRGTLLHVEQSANNTRSRKPCILANSPPACTRKSARECDAQRCVLTSHCTVKAIAQTGEHTQAQTLQRFQWMARKEPFVHRGCTVCSNQQKNTTITIRCVQSTGYSGIPKTHSALRTGQGLRCDTKSGEARSSRFASAHKNRNHCRSVIGGNGDMTLTAGRGEIRVHPPCA